MLCSPLIDGNTMNPHRQTETVDVAWSSRCWDRCNYFAAGTLINVDYLLLVSDVCVEISNGLVWRENIGYRDDKVGGIVGSLVEIWIEWIISASASLDVTFFRMAPRVDEQSKLRRASPASTARSASHSTNDSRDWKCYGCLSASIVITRNQWLDRTPSPVSFF